MPEKEVNQRPTLILSQDQHIETWIERFLIDRKISGYSPGTLGFYRCKLALFTVYCDSSAITSFAQVGPNEIRELLQWLENTGHNPGGRHAVYRAVKTLFRWWASETEPEEWKDPFKKVKAPKLSNVPLDPISIDAVKALLKTCKTSELIGSRDYAILYTLIDTGLRAGELLCLDIADLDIIAGSALIRRGKGGKPRTVFYGKATKKAIRKYLASREDENPSLWITADNDTLSYWGLVSMVKRRSHAAGIDPPCIHDFRRAFALGMLRNGVDIYSLQKLMGHADLQVLDRYLAQTTDDLANAHRKAGIGDKL